MNKLEKIQGLKREKKWDELINVFKELPDKEKRATSAVKSYVDACENIKLFDEDYLYYLKYLVNKSEKKSPFIAKLMEYYKDKNQDEYRKYYFRYLRALAYEKSFSRIEEEILTSIEEKKLSNEELYEIVLAISKKGNSELASSIINLIIDDPDINDNIHYKFLKLLLKINPKDKRLKILFINYYKTRYKEHKNIDKLIKMSKLMISDNLNEAVSSFENLILFDEGEYVYHHNFGTGRIEKVDYIFDDIKIRFENNVVKKFKRQNLNNIVTHLSNEDYNVYRFDKVDEFREIIKETPDKAVYIVLKKANKKLSQKEIKSFFVPYFIDAKDWVNEWKQIKKNCEKSLIIGKDLNYNYSVKTGKNKSIINEILKITDLKKKLFELEKAQANINDDDDKKKIENSFKNIPNLRAFFFLQKMFPEKYNTGDFLKERVKTKERLSGFMVDLVRARYIFDVFKHAEVIWPDFYDYMHDSLSQFSPFVQEQYIEYLYKNGKDERAFKLIKDTLDDIYLHPDLFLIVVKNKLKGIWGGDKDISIVRLFEKLFELYEYISIETISEQEKEIKQLYQQLMQKTRDLIKFNNYKYFRKSIGEVDNENRIKVLIKQIERIENLPVEMQTALKEIISEKFPNIEKEKKEKTNNFFTIKSSYDKKLKRYKRIIGIEIPENSERIYEAASMGDLSENAEYKAAKEKQRMLANSIKILKDEIETAIVRDLKDIKADFVTFGTKVKLINSKGEEFTYKILGPWETDIENNVISYNSGIGQALEGKKIGEKIKFKGEEYKIIYIKILDKT